MKVWALRRRLAEQQARGRRLLPNRALEGEVPVADSDKSPRRLRTLPRSAHWPIQQYLHLDLESGHRLYFVRYTFPVSSAMEFPVQKARIPAIRAEPLEMMRACGDYYLKRGKFS